MLFLKSVFSFIRDNWRAVSVVLIVLSYLFLFHKVETLSDENAELRSRVEAEEKISAAAEAASSEISDAMKVYYDARLESLAAAQKAYADETRKESERFTVEIDEIRGRQRRFSRSLSDLGERDPDALTCALAKQFGMKGCVK